ncbi:hypothetical protein L960_3P27c (plasmid) [Escherichia coli B7A]|nr:hypothetical protein L960_3P27c [Escherichia coli B7A]
MLFNNIQHRQDYNKVHSSKMCCSYFLIFFHCCFLQHHTF